MAMVKNGPFGEGTMVCKLRLAGCWLSYSQIFESFYDVCKSI